MKDIKCPGCDKLISFKNIMMFDEKEIEIISIGYAMRCLKCNTTFIPDMRTSKKATKKQIDAIKMNIKK